MDNYLVFNGQFVLADTPIIRAGNRGFKYADGLFESIRVMHGSPVFLEQHLERLYEGMRKLCLAIPENWDRLFLQELFNKLTTLNGIKSGRARLTVYRAGGGTYQPQSHQVDYVLELHALEDLQYTLNTEGLAVDIYEQHPKRITELGWYKTLNAQYYVLAAIEAQRRKLDDVLLINEQGYVIESQHSNLFFVKDQALYTPPIEDGPVGGIMRMQIINLALELNIPVYECHIVADNLLMADEVFLSNAIRGIQWVVSFRNKRYYHKLSEKLTTALNEWVLNSTKGLPETE